MHGWRWPVVTRDTVLFAGGLAGIFYEAVIHGGDVREALLIIYGGMIGLPAFLHHDEKKAAEPDDASRTAEA